MGGKKMKYKEKMMFKVKVVFVGIAAVFCVLSCNDGMSSVRSRDGGMAKKDRSQRTVIDSAEYIDFTVEKYNANAVKLEDVMFVLNNSTFKNGNSVIKVNASEKTAEVSSDSGRYNGRENCQIYGKFAIDVKAASSDCLYLRKDPHKEGFVMIDGIMFRNEAVPDLTVCLPLYGYSRNRIEVSPVMDGYIVMPSGTYWKQ
jgi:hypothetical protein